MLSGPASPCQAAAHTRKTQLPRHNARSLTSEKTEIWTLVSPKYLNLFPQPSMSQRAGARASPHPARTPTPSMRMLWITSWGHARYKSGHSKTQHLTPKKKARQKGQSYKGMLGHQRREADGMRASWGCPCGPRWPTWKDTSEAHTYRAWAGLWRPGFSGEVWASMWPPRASLVCELRKEKVHSNLKH